MAVRQVDRHRGLAVLVRSYRANVVARHRGVWMTGERPPSHARFSCHRAQTKCSNLDHLIHFLPIEITTR
jgi:hypothetical protein